MLDPIAKDSILQDFVKAKMNYANQHAGELQFFDAFTLAYEWFCQRNIPIWVCTSSPMQFCLNVYRQFSQLASFSGRTVWHEMYQNGKDEALMLAFKSMNIAPKDGIYIGDAPSDWNLWEKNCNIGITSCYTGLEQPISLGGFRLMKNIVHCISVA